MAGRGGQPLQHKDNPFQWAEKSVKSGRRPWAQTKKKPEYRGGSADWKCFYVPLRILRKQCLVHLPLQKSKAQLELKLEREVNMTGFCK